MTKTKTNPHEITHLDLCSGIGRFVLGLAAAGRDVSTLAFCENEPYCQAVLRKHWPDVPVYPDIKRFEAVKYRPIDILTAGYPCQPFSAAGEQKGTADDRHLWPWVFEIVKQCRPTWCIFENVPGHITLGLDEVLLDLEREAYAARTLALGAVAVDAPHRRQRIWICAKDVARNSESNRSNQKQGISQGPNPDPRGICQDVADTDGKGLEGRINEKLSTSECSQNVADTRSQRKKRLPENDENKGWQTIGETQSGGCSDDVADTEILGVQGHGAGGEQEPHAHAGEKVSLRGSQRSGLAR